MDKIYVIIFFLSFSACLIGYFIGLYMGKKIGYEEGLSKGRCEGYKMWNREYIAYVQKKAEDTYRKQLGL